jgi:hypothetical protein
MVVFSNTTTRDMLGQLFLLYGITTAVDLEHNFKNIREAWVPQQPVETLFKQIQDFVDYAEEGATTFCEAKKLTTDYSKTFSTGKIHSACRLWNERNPQDKTWNNFKIHFATAYCPHKQIQGETAAASGYATAAVVQPADDDLAEAATDAFANCFHFG